MGRYLFVEDAAGVEVEAELLAALVEDADDDPPVPALEFAELDDPPVASLLPEPESASLAAAPDPLPSPDAVADAPLFALP